jgi:transcription-repair coupling factor (superfamily II helicase)
VELPNPNGNKKQPIKTFVEMLHIRFAVPEANALGNGSLAHVSVDPGVLMKLVARSAKRGAQFTPQGIFRWPLTSAKAEDVLAETRALLEALDTSRP